MMNANAQPMADNISEAANAATLTVKGFAQGKNKKVRSRVDLRFMLVNFIPVNVLSSAPSCIDADKIDGSNLFQAATEGP